MAEYTILFILPKEHTYWWHAKVESRLIRQKKLIWKWVWKLKIERLSLHFLFFIYFVVKEKLPGNTLCQDPTWIHSDSFWEQTQNLLLKGLATASTVTHFNLQISSSLPPLSPPNKLTEFIKISNKRLLELELLCSNWEKLGYEIQYVFQLFFSHEWWLAIDGIVILGIFDQWLCSFCAILFYWLNLCMQKLLEYEFWNYPLLLHAKSKFSEIWYRSQISVLSSDIITINLCKCWMIT